MKLPSWEKIDVNKWRHIKPFTAKNAYSNCPYRATEPISSSAPE